MTAAHRAAAPRRIGDAPLLRFQRLQHFEAGPPIARQAGAALKIGDGFLGFGSDHAVGIADIIATPDQQRLQLSALGARKAGIVGRPGRLDAGRPRSRSDKIQIANA